MTEENNGSQGRPGPEESLLDFPLGPDSGEPGRVPETQVVLPLGTPGGGRLPGESSRVPRRTLSKGQKVLLPAAMILLAAVAWWVFWPKAPRAAFEPLSPDVGSVRVGESSEPISVMVTNVGERPMRVEQILLSGIAAVDFQLVGEDCSGTEVQGGGTCVMEIRFTPREMGPRAATVELRGELARSPATVALTGTGIAPILELAETSARFPALDVGARSEPFSLTVSNQGTAPLAVAGFDVQGPAVTDFLRQKDRCSGAVLEPGAECSIRWVFAPQAAGERQATVVVRSDSLVDAPGLTLSGVGVWSGPALTLESDSVDFGDQRIGEGSTSRTVRLINRRDEPVSRLSVVLASRGFEIASETCSRGSISPGSSCQIEVAFEPSEEESYSGQVEIRHAIAEPLRVGLAGRGVAPRLTVTTDSLDLGRVRVGERSRGQRLILSNEGSAEARIREVRLDGDDAFSKSLDRCTGGRLAPGASCFVEVLFRPRREGARMASLNFDPAPAQGPQKVEIRGFGIAARLVLDRESVDFGAIQRTTSAEVRIIAANRGTERLQIDSLRITGTGGYSRSGGTCGAAAIVDPGESCSIVLRFSPEAEGRSIASLEIEHDGVSGPRSVPLAGTGLPPPVARVRVEPEALRFGRQPVGKRSSIMTVTLSNPGTGRLELTGFRLRGEHAGDFYIVPASCQAAPYLVPGGDCTLGVRFVPTSAGAHGARLEIDHSAAGRSLSVTLSGEGFE